MVQDLKTRDGVIDKVIVEYESFYLACVMPSPSKQCTQKRRIKKRRGKSDGQQRGKESCFLFLTYVYIQKSLTDI